MLSPFCILACQQFRPYQCKGVVQITKGKKTLKVLVGLTDSST